MLNKTFQKLSLRFDRFSELYHQEYKIISSIGASKVKRWHALEGVLSSSWQAWCGFCRDVIYYSCNGATTLSGQIILPIESRPSYGRIAYVSKQVKDGKKIIEGKELQFHQEPTWGDPEVIINALSHYSPDNRSQLILALKNETSAPEHMRCVRNAVAHFSNHGISNVKKISIYYKGQGFIHPLDFLHWVSKQSGEEAFLDWLEDLREMARQMCE